MRQIITSFLKIGISPKYPSLKNDKIQIMNLVYALTPTSYALSATLRWYLGLGLGATLFHVSGAIMFTIIAFVSYMGKHELSWHLSLCTFLLLITADAFLDHLYLVNYLFFGVILFMMMLLFESEKAIRNVYVGLISISIFIFTYFSAYANDVATKLPIPIEITMLLIIIVLLSNVLIVSISFNQIKKKETELTSAISLKNAALNATKDATIIIDKKGTITGYNEHYLAMWGIQENTINQLDVPKLIDIMYAQIKNLDEIKTAVGYLVKNYTEDSYHILRLHNGKIIESHTQAQRIQNKVVGRVLNYRDITEKYLSKKQLQESEARFRSFYEHSPLAIIILEKNNDAFQDVNQRFCDILGYCSLSANQLKLKDICDQEYYEKFISEYRNLRKSGLDHFTLPNKCITKTGEKIWVNMHISLVRDANGMVISTVGMIEEINERKLQEEKINSLVTELQLFNEQLEEKVNARTNDLNQMNTDLHRSNQDLEQFAYIASHDLQEPLRMVGNFVQILERQYKDLIDDEGREYIHFVVSGVNRMSQLITNLLKYSRVGRKDSKMRVGSIADLVESKLFGLKKKVEETNAKIIIHHLPDEVFCEVQQIGMVFYNLISNALKFSGTQPIIEIGYKSQNESYLFYVKDNGIGIDRRYETKVFEIFKRLHRREDYEGTGIGLALCKKIVSRHKGNIWFESTLNKGTTFYFTIGKKIYNEQLLHLHTNLTRRG